MGELKRFTPGKTRRLAASKFTPPDWFGWLGVAAVFLLPVVRINTADGPWFFPLLSLGEWLLLPLGVVSLSMGLLTLWKVRERTVLPMWISAVLPAVLWLAVMGVAMFSSPYTACSGDMFLSWAVHLVFPTMAFLPLLSRPNWRDRIMWALAAGVALNVGVIAWQATQSGLTPGSEDWLGIGGFLVNQHNFSLAIAVALPLLAAWRGGNTEKYRSLAIVVCTFLLPAMALSVCFGLGGIAAVAAGLAVSLATWRGQAWIMGVFLCLIVFGHGSSARAERETAQRSLVATSFAMSIEEYDNALQSFVEKPYLGTGPETFCPGDGHAPIDTIKPYPWYATLLGGSGLLGLGMWLVLLAELAARALGRLGGRCLWYGGVLGGTAGLAVAGFWVDVLPEGAGALVGLLLAVSMLEEPQPPAEPRPARSRKRRKSTNAVVDSSSKPGKPDIRMIEDNEVSAADNP